MRAMNKTHATVTGIILGAALTVAGPAVAGKTAKPLKVPVNLIDADGKEKPAGTVTISETADGIVLATKLKGLPPGEHGFHLHEKGSCAPGDKDGKPAAGIAAGGHFDPDAVKVHKGPGGGGHKGDLPKLEANAKGEATAKLTVAGLKLEDVEGKALMIHEGGDNYSDTPKPLGGGGARIACGVIPTPAPAKGSGKPAEK
jgi:Cu-Zn family superoxide dismutase